MKRIKLILLIWLPVLALFFLISTYRHTHLLNKDEMAWTDAYSDKDVILFNSHDDVDTMYVRKITNNAPDLLGFHCFSTYLGETTYVGKIAHRSSRFDFNLLINKQYNNPSNTEFHIVFHNLNYTALLHNLDLESRNINGVDYTDLLILDSQCCEQRKPTDIDCVQFIWSKSKGLIQYTLADGTIYNRM